MKGDIKKKKKRNKVAQNNRTNKKHVPSHLHRNISKGDSAFEDYFFKLSLPIAQFFGEEKLIFKEKTCGPNHHPRLF